jgi:hypothetical protein
MTLMLGLSAATLAACGSGTHFGNLPRPASPVNVSVYIDNHRVSVSPSATGAGPVVFIVTNQGSQAVSMTVLPAGLSGAQAVADTGPISPQATAQVTVNLRQNTRYVVGTGPRGRTEAARATQAGGIRPAVLRIGNPRPSAKNQLMAP